MRLLQGDYSKENTYGAPVAMAQRWAEAGAKYLHIVDLDGARDGSSANLPLVKEIIQRVKLPVQLGGESAPGSLGGSARGASVPSALGQRRAQDPQFLKDAVRRYPKHVAVSVDARDGLECPDGWTRPAARML